jgi:hypothetical protein
MDLNSLNNNPEQIKQLIGLLQSLLPEDQSTNNKPIKKTRKKKTSSGKKEKDILNQFLYMPEANMHKDDLVIDKKLAKFPPTPRSRKFASIEVRCRSCGKTEQINPVLVHDKERYKCNRCSASK